MGQVTDVDVAPAVPAAARTPAQARTPAARPAPPEAAHVDAHEGTRHRVARSVLENGPSTAAALAARLDLTPAAVRRHLDTLLAEGVLEAREQRTYGPQRRGRGRPAKVFALTDAGRDAFYSTYDELAASALRFLAAEAGAGAVERFARSRVAELEERYRPQLLAAEPDQRARVLAEALSGDGYAATVRAAPTPGPAARPRAEGTQRGKGRGDGKAVLGEQLCQHHCPVAHVAEQFPQLCEAETEVFGRLLGTHVQRLATIAHGDGVCTTYIPPPPDTADTAGAGARRTGRPRPDRRPGRAARAAQTEQDDSDKSDKTENTPEHRRNPA
jgi:predicted ArsR family transcriptional regulator